jgi:putative transposase
MAKAKPIRCDEWRLLADVQTSRMAADTVATYRRLANALAGVFLAHWPEVHDLPVQDLESLFHDTRKTEGTTYGRWFSAAFPKVPSYLRRAATMAAHGAVSSFMTRYRSWQGGDRARRDARPPRWGGIQTWPTLYAANGGAGAMIRRDGDIVHIKLLDATSGDWLWRTAAVGRRGPRHGTEGAVPKSPALVVRGAALFLAQPYEFSRPRREKAPVDRVCSVDLGINKQATCSVVAADGTVIARRFIRLGAHIDRRDKALFAIRDKARRTMGKGGKLSIGFCRGLYERAKGLNLHVARGISRQVIAFARAHGARVVVFEDLTRFRPKGGARRSNLRQRFHGWLHRATVSQAEASCEELGLGFALVYPRGTSVWAYDGSGKVVRLRHDYGRCRFRTGKEYDCDLSASYNIAARWFVREQMRARRKAERDETTPAGGKTGWPARGGRSGTRKGPSTAGPGMPATLSSLWPSGVRAVGSAETPATAARAA